MKIWSRLKNTALPVKNTLSKLRTKLILAIYRFFSFAISSTDNRTLNVNIYFFISKTIEANFREKLTWKRRRLIHSYIWAIYFCNLTKLRTLRDLPVLCSVDHIDFFSDCPSRFFHLVMYCRFCVCLRSKIFAVKTCIKKDNK